MASRKQTRKRKPADTPEARENQMISLAEQLAEDQLIAGTATSQVISHYLKLGSTREKLEQEKMARENKLLDAKVEAIANGQRQDELFAEALEAMRSYTGQQVNRILDDEY